jgi:predicted PurR-regulated permease PerM
MLADARKIKAACLRLSPRRYRRDASELWDAFGFSLSRYISGLVLVMVVQGVISALALWILGVPYAAALGLWVALTAVVPLVGAWIGAVPGLLVSLAVSPATAAAVASSSSDAPATGSPVRSATVVWKVSRASSRPWLISGW